MNKNVKTLLAFTALAAAACNSQSRLPGVTGGTNYSLTTLRPLTQGDPGSRFAVALRMSGSTLSGTPYAGAHRDGYEGERPSNQNLPDPNARNGTLVVAPAGRNGSLDLISIRTEPMLGTNGYLTASSLALPSLNNTPGQESDVAVSSTGGYIYISLSGANRIQVAAISTGGALIPIKIISVDQHPTQLAAGLTPIGEMVFGIASNGSTLFALRNENGIISPYTNLKHFGRQQLKALKLTPRGDMLAIASTGPAGGRVDFCDVRKLREPEADVQSYTEGGFLRTCIPGDPQLAESGWTGVTSRYDQNGFGAQMVKGNPIRLAINEQLVTFVDPNQGPYILDTPNVPDMNRLYFDHHGLVPGYVNGGANNRVINVNPRDRGAQQYKDILLHPNPTASSIIELNDNVVSCRPTDNFSAVGTFMGDTAIPGRPTALALDPGTPDDPTAGRFLLIADQDKGIWVATLTELCFSLDTGQGYVPLPGAFKAAVLPFIPR